MIEDGVIAGTHIDRNPGATCLYETREAKPFRAGDGYLFKLGEPERVDWYARGRAATREEVEESIRTGYPILLKEALKDGPKAVAELEKCLATAYPLLPKAA